ncbi:hypothetical protein SAMN05518801_104154 [Novosphingobium sp. CF614]|uniref:hypothetical protein n=1 Tax=Novosphingobium sp. CF614 TaxID=1884364 RepID=UPI0008F12972|nr:hypothetical protein [Novosphingobium sp. CF614]SFF95821.1 hypothetical protein SAMN05518801_104154 [Novosphingobium sp. CF614]
MSATLFALALFACSEDATACQRLDVPAQTYGSRAQCTARLGEALDTEAARKADAPTVYAQCLATRQMARLGKGMLDLTKVNGARFGAAEY